MKSFMFEEIDTQWILLILGWEHTLTIVTMSKTIQQDSLNSLIMMTLDSSSLNYILGEKQSV